MIKPQTFNFVVKIRCVPEAPTINLWLNIFLIFNAETWGYFILTVIIAGTALYYFYKFYHHQENWWYCVAIGFFVTISVSVPINPSGALLRTYFLIFCIYGILVTTTFNSFLMSTIARPMKFIQISTTEGLINNSMQLYAEKETIALYSRDTSEVMDFHLQFFFYKKKIVLPSYLHISLKISESVPISTHV